jgi:hypothetical protein
VCEVHRQAILFNKGIGNENMCEVNRQQINSSHYYNHLDDDFGSESEMTLDKVVQWRHHQITTTPEDLVCQDVRLQ